MKNKTSLSIFLFLFPLIGISQTNSPSLKYFETYLKVNQIVLLGEIHGTNEAPTLTLALIKKGVEHKIPVTIFLELPKTNQYAIESFLKSEGTIEDKLKILELDFWKRSTQDGRTSLAMLNLLDSIRALNTQVKYDLKVILIDESSSLDRDKSMSENIINTMKQDPDRLFIGLMGNYHTRITEGSGAIGERLRKSEYNALALTVSYSDGEAWICNSSGCGVQKMTSKGFPEEYRIYSFDQLKDYDGFVEIGNISASKPAIQYFNK